MGLGRGRILGDPGVWWVEVCSRGTASTAWPGGQREAVLPFLSGDAGFDYWTDGDAQSLILDALKLVYVGFASGREPDSCCIWKDTFIWLYKLGGWSPCPGPRLCPWGLSGFGGGLMLWRLFQWYKEMGKKGVISHFKDLWLLLGENRGIVNWDCWAGVHLPGSRGEQSNRRCPGRCPTCSPWPTPR